MSTEEIKTLVMRVATEMASKGPGWAQEGVVLREIRDQITQKQGRPDLETQQAVLNAWHDLFAERKLSWGYDLTNATSPFFHVR